MAFSTRNKYNKNRYNFPGKQEHMRHIYLIGEKKSAKILVGKNKKSAKNQSLGQNLYQFLKFNHFLPTFFYR